MQLAVIFALLLLGVSAFALKSLAQGRQQRRLVVTPTSFYHLEPLREGRTAVRWYYAGQPAITLVYGPERLEQTNVGETTLGDQPLREQLARMASDVWTYPDLFGIPKRVSEAQAAA